jgi:hypothetical protein
VVNNDNPAITAVTAEYAALREEIGRCQDHRNQLFSIALAILAAIVGLAGVENHTGKEANEVGIVFLLAPMLFIFLGSAYVDRGRRMLVIAAYVNTLLRKQATTLAGEQVWRWELFKRAQFEHSRRVERMVGRILDGLRGLIFVACGVVSLGLYLALPLKSPDSVRLALVIVNIDLLFALAVLVWWVEESSGVPASWPDQTRHRGRRAVLLWLVALSVFANVAAIVVLVARHNVRTLTISSRAM